MGDRIYARIVFGGHIETVEEMETFISAIGDAAVNDNTDESYISDAGEARSSVRKAVEQQYQPEYYDAEVNYGVFNELEAMVKQIPGLGCTTWHEAGGDYPAGVRTVMPDGTSHRCDVADGEPVTNLDALVSARKSYNVLAALDQILVDMNRACGNDMPPFTVSPAVAAWLKIFAAAA